jgi:hypothetical protein
MYHLFAFVFILSGSHITVFATVFAATAATATTTR